jgi:hypothetical protein
VFLDTGVFPRDFKQQRNNNREEINKNKRTKYIRIKLNEKKKERLMEKGQGHEGRMWPSRSWFFCATDR